MRFLLQGNYLTVAEYSSNSSTDTGLECLHVENGQDISNRNTSCQSVRENIRQRFSRCVRTMVVSRNDLFQNYARVCTVK